MSDDLSFDRRFVGGLAAGHEAGGPTAGVQEDGHPPDAFNIVSRLKTEYDLQAAGKAQHAN